MHSTKLRGQNQDDDEVAQYRRPIKGTYHFIPTDKPSPHIQKNGTAALRPDTYEALVYAVSPRT